MLSLENLKKFTKEFQTIEKNVVREYIQNLFLSSLYKSSESEKLLFKGGTALRLIYGSPRFSEDLDFSGVDIHRSKTIEELFLDTLLEIEEKGIKTGLKEAKTTTGGYLGIVHYEVYNLKEDMKFEVSLRKNKHLSKEITTIVNDYIPAYTLVHLSGENIVKGKTKALLERRKPRDFYDFYFFLRHPELHKFIEKDSFEEVFEILKEKEINFKEDLSVLLPVSHQTILKDFESTLIKEIKKYIG